MSCTASNFALVRSSDSADPLPSAPCSLHPGCCCLQVHIAERHLIPRLLGEHGLHPGQLVFPEGETGGTGLGGLCWGGCAGGRLGGWVVRVQRSQQEGVKEVSVEWAGWSCSAD